jgi:hypothetical protein
MYVRHSCESEKFVLSSDGWDAGSKNVNEAVVAPGGLRSAGILSLESGGPFCVDAFGRNLASVTAKMASHLMYLTEML